jgi:predicted amidohydrolase
VHPTLSGTPVYPGDGLGLAVVDGLPIGVLICSELWIPEVARVLAVRGAEVLLAPAGGGFHAVARNWRLIAQARAIENECHVALTQHLFGAEEGSALIAGPEGTEARLEEEGVAVAELDLARARWLRATDDSMREPKPFSALPGLLRARRPELYSELSEPRPGLYDYTGRGER